MTEEELFSAHEFAIITAAPEKAIEDDELPRYGDKGRILVRVDGLSDGPYRFDMEVLCHDGDSSTFWVQEGTGFEYWIDEHIKSFPSIPGTYVIEGVHGHYYRGTWGYEDDWEEWKFDSIRPATADEIENEALF